ncbi:MAG: Rrf2 family transcriptional regulator [Pseudazoarcus pumilus]|nr:Rrf2 family transcriptional regulator [Pseudazoarcus pumilus]
MQLNRFTDYGLRVLMYLHALEAEERVTTDSIARRFDIPVNHLNKVVTRLVHLGWVSSRPGRNGGIRLAELDSPLRLGDVLRELEGHPTLINCSEPPCPLRGNCTLQQVLDEGRKAFYAEMNRHTLADMTIAPTRTLLQRLRHEEPLKRACP